MQSSARVRSLGPDERKIGGVLAPSSGCATCRTDRALTSFTHRGLPLAAE